MLKRSGVSSAAVQHGIVISSVVNAVTTTDKRRRTGWKQTMNQSDLDRLDARVIGLIRQCLDMTNYGKCCGRLINYKNANFCQFCGKPLEHGEPVERQTERIPMSRPSGDQRQSPLVRVGFCHQVASKGANKGKMCSRVSTHKGKHAYNRDVILNDY